MDHENVDEAPPQSKSWNRLVAVADSRPRKKLKRTVIDCPAVVIKVRLWIILANHNLPLQLDSVSKESLQYFQPYRENLFPLHLQNIIRAGHFSKLRTDCTMSELRLHNQFGETLIHLLCKNRWIPGIIEMIKWLLDEVHLPLNVRDRHGRSPLHVACMVPPSCYLVDGNVKESFDLVRFLVARAPELLLFEDNHGETPLDLVSYQDCLEWNEILESSLSHTTSNVRRIRQSLAPPFSSTRTADDTNAE